MRALSLSLLSALAVFGGCSSSNGDSPVGSATIGPAGGEVTVLTGVRNVGLVLTIPAGALTAPTEIRVFDVPPPPVPPNAVVAAAPGDLVRIEPAAITLAVPATLRLPYRPAAVLQSAPGNVVVYRNSHGFVVDLVPSLVDVGAAFVETQTNLLGTFAVKVGPTAAIPAGYLPALGETMTLTDGYSFTIEQPTPAQTYVPTGSLRWRIRSGTIDESLYVKDGAIVARDSTSPSWLESWDDPYFLWNDARLQLNFAGSTSTQVAVPIYGAVAAGSMFVSSSWVYQSPVAIGGNDYRDVLQLRIDLAWQREDLGTGQRRYDLVFAPTVGLLSFAEDGVVHTRVLP